MWTKNWRVHDIFAAKIIRFFFRQICLFYHVFFFVVRLIWYAFAHCRYRYIPAKIHFFRRIRTRNANLIAKFISVLIWRTQVFRYHFAVFIILLFSFIHYLFNEFLFCEQFFWSMCAIMWARDIHGSIWTKFIILMQDRYL